MADSRAEDLLTAPRGLQLLELISQRPSVELTDGELNGLLLQLDLHVSRFRGDYEEHLEELKTRAPLLLNLAGWLPRRMPHWWHDLDRTQQIWVGRSPETPTESHLVVDVTRFGDETPKPRRALWTSTFVPVVVSPWLHEPEGQFSGPHHLWKLAVTDSARVLEIHSRAAWSAFARSYPSMDVAYSPTGRFPRPASSVRLDPDWSKVSEDWDGVHLSVGGWLTAEDVPSESDGVTTELRNWDMESTVWLRWSFSSVARLPAA